RSRGKSDRGFQGLHGDCPGITQRCGMDERPKTRGIVAGRKSYSISEAFLGEWPDFAATGTERLVARAVEVPSRCEEAGPGTYSAIAQSRLCERRRLGLWRLLWPC